MNQKLSKKKDHRRSRSRSRRSSSDSRHRKHKHHKKHSHKHHDRSVSPRKMPKVEQQKQEQKPIVPEIKEVKEVKRVEVEQPTITQIPQIPQVNKEQTEGFRRRKTMFIKNLPEKPRRSTTYVQKFKEIQLTTNNFKVSYDRKMIITIYSVRFTPFIDPTNQNLKREVLFSKQTELSERLGAFIFYGNILLGAGECQDFHFKMEKVINFDEREYFVEIKKLKTIKLGDIEDPDPQKYDSAMRFFNFMIKDYFKTLNYFEHGKLKRFHDIRSRSVIPQTELQVIPGFAANFQLAEKDFFFKVDISHRIVRTTSALDFINQHYKKSQQEGKSKEDIRRLLSHSMSRQLVLTNYGTFRTYQVDDLLYDKNTSEFSIDVKDALGKDSSITIDDYFKQRYQYTIINKKAPLLIYKERKTEKLLYLVPELCIMAGMPENMNEQIRKKIQEKCQTNPNERLQRIIKVQAQLQHTRSTERINAEVLSSQFGIQMSDLPVKVMGKHLAMPEIMFGNKSIMPSGDKENVSFNLSNLQAFHTEIQANFALIYPPEFNGQEFIQLMENQTKQFGIKLANPSELFKLKEMRNEQFKDIQHILQHKIKKSTNIVIIILNDFLKKYYGDIKKITLTEPCAICSQVVLTNSIARKGISQITSKVITQVLDKIGNTLWAATLPKQWMPKTMIVSVIVEKGFGGFIASVNQNCTKYYSQISKNIDDRLLLRDIDKLFEAAFTAYKQNNGYYPEYVIYFRDGLDDEQINRLLSTEVETIKLIANKLNPNFQSRMIVINITFSVITKLFREEKGNIFNAPGGTIVDHTITTRNYEFILSPVYSHRGCPKPLLYQVVYDNIKIPMELLQDFVYCQCFNYQNWPGPIKLPAIVKNTQRLTKFVADVTQVDTTESLRQKMYYL